MAITDKAKYLVGMRDLTRQYPQLQMPLEIKTHTVYGEHANNSAKRAHTE